MLVKADARSLCGHIGGLRLRGQSGLLVLLRKVHKSKAKRGISYLSYSYRLELGAAGYVYVTVRSQVVYVG